MKQNRYRKFIGMSICFLFTLQILFAPVWAYDEPTPKTDYSDAVEIVELRDQYTRHYKLEDKTFIAVTYTEPVNYLKDGVWEEIDNTLQLVEDDNLEPVYQNKENSYRVTFPQTLNDDNQILIEKDGYEISWQISSANRTKSSGLGEIVANTVATSETTENDDIFVASKSTTRFIYRNLFSDIDLLYTVKPDAIKEDIIINRPIEDVSFTFDVNVKGLTAKKNDDNSISFYSSDDEVVFVIQSPYMTDSAEEPALSADIELNIIETESGYKIDLIPDSDWIMSPDRVFPIYIDPTVSSSQVQTDIVDTYVHYGDAAGDHRLADRLVVGTKSGELCRSFIQTLIPSIPSGSGITDARLNLSITYGTTTMQNIDVYRVNSSWSSYTMTWAIQNSISKTLVKSNVSSTAYSNYPSSYRYSCDVTNTIMNIYNGILSNNGFMVKYSNESISDYNRFYSSDYTTSTVRPTLVITYTNDYYGNRSYVTSTGTGQNCMGYALDYPDFIDFYDLGMSDSVLNGYTLTSQLLDYTKSRSENWMNNHSIGYDSLPYYNANIMGGQYRVVLRVGYDDINGNSVFDWDTGWGDRFDYHWWYQTNTGQWAEKAGRSDSQLISGTSGSTNPYYVSWIGYVTYDSICIYYAIDN